MAVAYIVDAVRTAGGRRGGRLAGIHAVDLGAATLNAIAERNDFDPSAIEDVITGCVMQGGEQAGDVGRNAVLASNLPDSIPSVSIDRQCGSSQQSIQFAAQGVMSGTQDMVLAHGIESMTRVPMGSTFKLFKDAGLGSNKSEGLEKAYPGIQFSQFMGAEMLVKKHGFNRDDLDQFALESHQKAIRATEAGAFDNEIVGVKIQTPEGDDVHKVDEGIRFDATKESIGSVKVLQEGGAITAANASQICDGSSAVLVCSEQALKDHGLTPRARIVNLTVTAGDPVIMLEEPLFATDRALQRAGMNIGDIDLYEVNEAFAPVPLAWLKHVGADRDKINVNGGAIALGHPLGASGTKLMATLLNAMESRGSKYGLQTMCEGGGQANVTIIERLG
ncbi:acetyl-CoA C-acetyltransferase [Parasphingorhabdus flavimaris]|jgi:acetyl-CoA C-acetyltransferase|uniref:Acetyl-CoA C-acetyltransferase n=1 Tax=Parasphingorhabdus flavimaris TaxID=266812 RepID=A0ABX2N314_9SPHN|nr:acetyl-CoA C-acetyltransferase [Parasphingorhabdus flavimaris]NVD28083.1 acetyl-CoA C-acetyltransferase [Parasphingorhabdus flavimaris]|tara:strand:+ start:8910 stop:10082 length:1173 start_codon:yes stop_codon:yes gene_type:complete